MSPEPDAVVHPSPDRLLDLVHGLVPPAERDTILAHLAICPDCERRFHDCAASHERARAAWSLGVAKSTPAAPGAVVAMPRDDASRRRIPPLGWAFAAALLVAAGAFLVLRPQPLDVAWLPPPDASVLTRDAVAGPTDSLVLAGLDAYTRRDLAAARRLLEGARSIGPMEQARRVYLANTLLRLGASRAALETLRGVAFAEVPEPWRGESRWALAEALAATRHREAADSLLRVLALEPGAVGERARSALGARRP